ncbi:CoA transferase [Rhodoplanes sp. Z2-YC6860]|uniref:CoA transferase n=1 Tax=Rhodoplanes sp. Z2-YC6860 TaxID=674703 RepID=UPI00078CC043|nr:CoA transferase [Rhodoplanes sp. Z2-YC6860]AMN44624.1 CoA-transferase family III, caib/baif family protein [Rhodoplanes sp. Z2-YC6860]
MNAKQSLTKLWNDLGLPAEALDRVALTGADPALPSSFHVGQMAQVSIGAAALAATELHRRRGGRAQQVTVDARSAAIEFRSERYLRVNGGEAPELWDKIAGAYRCGDGNWVRIHTNFPHHRDGVLKLLQCEHSREAVAKAFESWSAEKFEDAAAAAGMVVAKARTFAEWDAHPQGAAVRTVPLITLEKIGDAPKLSVPAGSRPLENLRVLEMTRVLAGPVCGRTLAAHGADVLRVISPNLPTIDVADIDTGRGKRSAHVDLATSEGRSDFRALLQGADVFVQSYRPGAVAARGFGPKDAAAIRPGIVCVSLSAYGHVGSWAARRGFDSLTQTATGLNFAEAEAAGKTGLVALPCQALDHASGYLMALGAITALLRRIDEGGSWHVRVALARTGLWLRDMGRVADGFAASDIDFAQAADRLATYPSAFGTLTAVRHAAEMSETPAQWALPSAPFGTHPPRW